MFKKAIAKKVLNKIIKLPLFMFQDMISSLPDMACRSHSTLPSHRCLLATLLRRLATAHLSPGTLLPRPGTRLPRQGSRCTLRPNKYILYPNSEFLYCGFLVDMFWRKFMKSSSATVLSSSPNSKSPPAYGLAGCPMGGENCPCGG